MKPTKEPSKKGKKPTCSNCRVYGHPKNKCYDYWQKKNERELKTRNFDDDQRAK